jgi:hypothetical protein
MCADNMILVAPLEDCAETIVTSPVSVPDEGSETVLVESVIFSVPGRAWDEARRS